MPYKVWKFSILTKCYFCIVRKGPNEALKNEELPLSDLVWIFPVKISLAGSFGCSCQMQSEAFCYLSHSCHGQRELYLEHASYIELYLVILNCIHSYWILLSNIELYQVILKYIKSYRILLYYSEWLINFLCQIRHICLLYEIKIFSCESNSRNSSLDASVYQYVLNG